MKKRDSAFERVGSHSFPGTSLAGTPAFKLLGWLSRSFLSLETFGTLISFSPAKV